MPAPNNYGGRGYTYRGTEGFKPKRISKQTKPRSVPCPTCEAKAGEPCVWPSGGDRAYHIARRRMAVRAYLDEREGKTKS